MTPNQNGGGTTGPNDFQNYPVLTAVAPDGIGTNVQGTFNSRGNPMSCTPSSSSPTLSPGPP